MLVVHHLCSSGIDQWSDGGKGRQEEIFGASRDEKEPDLLFKINMESNGIDLTGQWLCGC